MKIERTKKGIFNKIKNGIFNFWYLSERFLSHSQIFMDRSVVTCYVCREDSRGEYQELKTSQEMILKEYSERYEGRNGGLFAKITIVGDNLYFVK